jgi:hypothetical protein
MGSEVYEAGEEMTRSLRALREAEEADQANTLAATKSQTDKLMSDVAATLETKVCGLCNVASRCFQARLTWEGILGHPPSPTPEIEAYIALRWRDLKARNPTSLDQLKKLRDTKMAQNSQQADADTKRCFTRGSTPSFLRRSCEGR